MREHEEKLRQLEETLTARRQQVGQAQRDAQNIEQVREKNSVSHIVLVFRKNVDFKNFVCFSLLNKGTVDWDNHTCIYLFVELLLGKDKH